LSGPSEFRPDQIGDSFDFLADLIQKTPVNAGFAARNDRLDLCEVHDLNITATKNREVNGVSRHYL
jgi:hypothetical protein